MKYLLIVEEAAMFLGAVYGLHLLDISLAWWAYVLLFFAPDLGMAGYAFNPRIGALTYNLLHHKGIAISLLVAGFVTGHQWLLLSGLLMFGHAAFDRVLGYGLKYPDRFAHTHLGEIGKGRSSIAGE